MSEARARAHAITRLVEDSLYWSLGSERWRNDAHYPITRHACFAVVPGFLRWLIAGFVRRKVIQAMHSHGIGREDDAWTVNRGKADLEALSGLLADRPFFLADRVRTVDATVFGALTNLRHAPYPSPLTEAMRTDERLGAWEQRVRELAWPDWDELPA